MRDEENQIRDEETQYIEIIKHNVYGSSRTMLNLGHIVSVAKQVFDEQTGEELAQIKEHFGAAFDEAKLVAEIAVKMFARITGLVMPATTTRALSQTGEGELVSDLVDRGMSLLN